MMAITIGIPRSLLYYHYQELWEIFFKELGCQLIYSPNTNKKIVENGKNYIVDESCLSMKIHMGHIDYLSKKCDYILVPYIDRFSKAEILCANFHGITDLAMNLFPDQILSYHIDIKKKDEKKAFIKMGLDLGFPRVEIVSAYDKAKIISQHEHAKLVEENKKLVADSKKIKILMVGHLYNVYDDFVGKPIAQYLTKNKVNVIYAHLNDNHPKAYKKYSSTLYWLYNQELVNGVEQFEKDVDGIILLTTFPCGPDSLVNDILVRKLKKPTIQLIIDELNSGTGLETRLESFVDILERKRNQNEEEDN